MADLWRVDSVVVASF